LLRSRWSFVIVGLIGLYAAPASAFPSAKLIYVRGQGAESCPEEMELRMSVAHRLGYDPFNAASGRALMVVIEAQEQRLAARLELVNEQGVSQGERRFEAAPDRCADLVRALALSMSIAIDPEGVEAEESPPVARRAAPPDHRARAEIRDAGDRSSAPGAKSVLRFGLGGQAAVGVAPATVAGGLLAGTWRQGVLSLGLELRADAAGARKLPNGARVQSQLIAVGLLPCVHYQPALLCAVGSWGRIQATSDAAQAHIDVGHFAAAGLRIGTEWSLGSRLLLRTHTDLLATLVPVRIALDGRTVWELSAMTGSFGATLFTTLP
jgi:hypothetical protein